MRKAWLPLVLAVCSVALLGWKRPAGINVKASSARASSAQAGTVAAPEKARKVLAYVQSHHGHAPKGYEGGREFKNWDGKLPKLDGQGRPLTYHEYDVNPHKARVNRGAERLVIGNDGKAYFSADHYHTFVTLGP